MIRISDIVALERARQAAEYGRRLIAQDETLRRLSLIWSIVLAVSTTVAVYAQLAGVPVPSSAIAGIASMLSVAAVAYIYADHAARKDKLDATWHENTAAAQQQITAMQAQSEDTQQQMLAELGRMRAAERERDAVVADMMARVSIALQRNHDEIVALRTASRSQDVSVEQLAAGLAQVAQVAEHNGGVIELMAQDISIMEDRHEREMEKAVTEARNAGVAEGFGLGYEARDAEGPGGGPHILRPGP
jgi:hypothetical protein